MRHEYNRMADQLSELTLACMADGNWCAAHRLLHWLYDIDCIEMDDVNFWMIHDKF